MRQFAIGDIHGCNQTLLTLLDRLNVQPDDEFYFLGDYVDRGPDSKGVFDTIFDLQNKVNKVVCLRGNHEQLMLDAFSPDPDDYERWMGLAGGRATHLSFLNVEAQEFQKYMAFMRELPLVHTVGKYILVHGGLNFNQTDPLSSSHQMMWLRDWYDKINYSWLSDRCILHGHTPQKKNRIEFLYQNRERNRFLNLDAGCVFYTEAHLGYLACFDMQSEALIFQPNVDGDYDW
jgi:serine/threonine protein phosphatase 1